VHKQIIINPAAGVGLTDKQLNALKNKLSEASIPFDLQLSKGLNHIYSICKELDESCDEVILAGGDGSVQEAIKGLLTKNIKLSIIPSGTGNDLYRSLYPELKNCHIDVVIDQILENAFQKVNICEANDNVFINVASMGLDAEIVANSLILRKFIHSSKTYLLSALYTILFYKPKTYHITTDDRTLTLKAYLIAVGNGRFYGGGMAITPKAQISDSVLDICIVKSMNRFKLLKLLPTVYSGNHLQFSEVDYFKSKTIKIESQKIELLNLDGELSHTTVLSVNSHHGTLLAR
jgi:YegS/Rv2252/BmrU family lipid kinase